MCDSVELSQGLKPYIWATFSLSRRNHTWENNCLKKLKFLSLMFKKCSLLACHNNITVLQNFGYILIFATILLSVWDNMYSQNYFISLFIVKISWRTHPQGSIGLERFLCLLHLFEYYSKAFLDHGLHWGVLRKFLSCTDSPHRRLDTDQSPSVRYLCPPSKQHVIHHS